MYTYKFRLFFDEIEDFVRDFELLADQTFLDFHRAIIQNISGLDDKELASFYICDSNWKELKEITLIDMDDSDDEEMQQMPKLTMEEAVLKDLIDDPHQRLIYEIDFLNPRTFFIDLLKSSEANPKFDYPRCTASTGELPKQTAGNQKDEFDFSDLKEEDFDADDDADDYYSEEDLQSLSDDIEF